MKYSNRIAFRKCKQYRHSSQTAQYPRCACAGSTSRAARHALAVLSESQADDLMPLPSPSEQMVGGTIPEGNEDEYIDDQDSIDRDLSMAAAANEVDLGPQRHFRNSNIPGAPQQPIPMDGLMLGEDGGILEGQETSGQFEGDVALDDMAFGFRSMGAVSDSGHLSENILEGSEPLEGSDAVLSGQMMPVAAYATAVPPLQVPRGKPHAYSDLMGRDSGRGSVQSLRMPVVHEEGESIAGSSTLDEETQPPAPGAVSVSGRQVRPA